MATRVEVSGAQSISYAQAWDAENRLVAVTNTMTWQVTRYAYDADGVRVARTDPGGATVLYGELQ